MDNLKKLGALLIALGVLGFTATVILSERQNCGTCGTLPAISFLVCMLGFALYFPSLLEEEAGQLSTMRILAFAVALVFCFTYIRLAWTATSLQDLTIDEKWVYILGITIGGKAVQRFGENPPSNNPKPPSATDIK